MREGSKSSSVSCANKQFVSALGAKVGFAETGVPLVNQREQLHLAVTSRAPTLSLAIRILRRNPRNRLRASRGTCNVTFLGGDQRSLKLMRHAAFMLHTKDCKSLIPIDSLSSRSLGHSSRKL